MGLIGWLKAITQRIVFTSPTYYSNRNNNLLNLAHAVRVSHPPHFVQLDSTKDYPIW